MQEATQLACLPVTTTAIPDAFLRIWRERATGVLELTGSRHRKFVSFAVGVVTTAASTDRDDRFSNTLLTESVISLQMLSDALDVSLRDNVRLGEALVEQGALTEARVRHWLRVQFQRIVDDVFRWDDGTVAFEDRHVAVGPIALGVPAHRMVVEAVRRQTYWTRVAEYLEGLNTEFIASPNPPAEIDSYGLNREELALFEAAEARATAGELCRSSALTDYEAARTIWLLSLLGLIQKG